VVSIETSNPAEEYYRGSEKRRYTYFHESVCINIMLFIIFLLFYQVVELKLLRQCSEK